MIGLIMHVHRRNFFLKGGGVGVSNSGPSLYVGHARLSGCDATIQSG